MSSFTSAKTTTTSVCQRRCFALLVSRRISSSRRNATTRTTTMPSRYFHRHHHQTKKVFVAPLRATKKTFTSFQELIDESDVPVLVDFYATWCGPCKLASEMCGRLAGMPEFKDKLKFVKIDTEKYAELSSKWKVEGLPTFVLFHRGKVLDRIEGLPSEAQMRDRLNYFLQQAK
jgi:thioredoxin